MKKIAHLHRLPFIFIILYSTSNLGHTQNSPQTKVEAPTIQVGDSWVYDNIDGWKNSKESTSTVIVTSVSEKTFQTESKNDKNGEITKTIRNMDLNFIEKETAVGKRIADPYNPSFSFPLEIGKKWEQKVTFSRTFEKDRKSVANLKGEVIGWEKITVSAGTFNALRVEVKGYYNASNGSGSWAGSINEIYWYVPEIKNSVKTIYKDTSDGKPYSNEITELKEFKLTK